MTGADAARPGVGERIELMVSHCDPTVNLHDVLWARREGAIVDRWPVDLRGCCQ